MWTELQCERPPMSDVSVCSLSTHGLGRLKLKALFEFMKVYSRRGDVASKSV